MDHFNKNSSPFTLSFTNIFYEIGAKTANDNPNVKGAKTILNDISGSFKSGQITAIMGTSGCGKTSLMNGLTNRVLLKGNDKFSGETYINSERVLPNSIVNYCGYVMQDDVLFPFLTPKENMTIACRLRKPVSNDKVEECVETVISALELSSCQNTLIGNVEIKGVSGGERKRTSIGMELITNPSILFLDEPTSGLDSQTSYSTISLLKKLAIEKNIMIICSIHQPSSNIFNIFDRLLIMDKGSIIYSGIPNKVTDYFAEIHKPLGERSNPADSFMRLIKINDKSDDPNFFSKKYDSIGVKAAVLSEIKKSLEEDKSNTVISKKEGRAGFFESTSILTKRAFINVVRNPMLFKLRVLFSLFFSFIVSLIFWKLGRDEFDNVYARINFFFFVAINVHGTQLNGTILSFPSERPVFMREYSNKLYSVESYFAAKNIVETPVAFICCSFFVAIVYFTSSQRIDSPTYFFVFYCVYLLEAFSAQSLGYLAGAVFSDVQQAFSISNIVILIMILCSGVLISDSSMPIYIFWLKYLSPLKYVIEVAVTNEFVDNSSIMFNGMNSEQILTELGYNIGIPFCFLFLSAFIVIPRVAALYFLKRSVNIK